MFSPCYFHVIISIGILESNSLSLSIPSRTKWTLVYLLMLYSTSAEGLSLESYAGLNSLKPFISKLRICGLDCFSKIQSHL